MTSNSAAEIRTELRNILRQRNDLRRPLNRFEANPNAGSGQPPHYVAFDSQPRRPIIGTRLQLASLVLPDERILDSAYRFAESVWHIKDRLKIWVGVAGCDIEIESFARSKKPLLIVADLANNKKHGVLDRPRSGRSPRLGVILRESEGKRLDEDGSGLVQFDTSKNGIVEFYYDGARREKELLVTNPQPIAFNLEVLVDDGAISLGNAIEYIESAFLEWLPVIKESGVLSADDRESKELARELNL